MQTSEEVEEVNQDKIEERDVSAEQEHGDDDDERGIGQLLVALNPLLFGLPRPGRFLQLHLYFVEETFAFADHEDVVRKRAAAVQQVRRDSNPQPTVLET